MDQRDATHVLFGAVKELTDAGYAVTGSLHFVKLRDGSSTEQTADCVFGTVEKPANHVRFRAVPRGASKALSPAAQAVIHAHQDPGNSPARPLEASVGDAMGAAVVGDACQKCGGMLWLPSVPCKTCFNCGEPSGGCS